MTECPFVSCLCPTYNRPELLARSIEFFRSQDYPLDRRELVIFDDAEFPQDTTHDLLFDGHALIRYSAFDVRFPSLPDKYNAMARFAKGDILCVWEDDDEYRPWHISAHVAALEHGTFSKPSRVLSDYGEPAGTYHEEGGDGRFHASMAFTRGLLDKIGGWPLTKRADFDQQMIARLAAAGLAVDPLAHYPSPSYVFRWHTGAYHGQSTMRGPDDETWYDRVPA